MDVTESCIGLQDLPDATVERGEGRYLGVVSYASDPIEVDYLRLWVGQSVQIFRRVQHQLQDRYIQESIHCQTTRKTENYVQYFTLSVLSGEGPEHAT